MAGPIPLETLTIDSSEAVSARATEWSAVQIVKIDATAVDTTTFSFDVSHVKSIATVIPVELDSGNNVSTSDMDISWSGKTITIADGASYDISATGDNITLLVIGN